MLKESLDALKFLFIGPLILLMLLVINWMTSPGEWWVQWPALGIGIAWMICLLRVIRDAILLGGLSALGVYLWKKRDAQQRQAQEPRDPNRVG